MELSLDEFHQFSPLFEPDILEAIRVETCVANRNSFGGTSYQQVELAMDSARHTLSKQQKQTKLYNPAK
jgi:argininosuccinate lyase